MQSQSLKDYPLLGPEIPAVCTSLDIAHTGTYSAKNGGKCAAAAVAFLEWWFRGDETAKRKFTHPESKVVRSIALECCDEKRRWGVLKRFV
jgi:hypothetical protein